MFPRISKKGTKRRQFLGKKVTKRRLFFSKKVTTNYIKLWIHSRYVYTWIVKSFSCQINTFHFYYDVIPGKKPNLHIPYWTKVRRTKVTKFWLGDELLSDEIVSENSVRQYNIGTLKAQDTASSSISRNRNFVSFVRRNICLTKILSDKVLSDKVLHWQELNNAFLNLPVFGN